jgi:TolB-like protein/Tfp pilus assembly protein PilF
VVLTLLLAVLPIVRRIQGASAAKRALPIKSLAVLPLANFSGDPNQEYFVDGMTDKLITNLAQLSSFRVVSRTSIMQYKNSRKPLLQIARELQVDAVVEGSVVRSGDQVRITAQLIDARDDRHLWAQSYDRDLRDILQLQGAVAGDIAEKVSSNLLSAQAQPPSSAAPSLNLAAYDDYLKGRYYSQRLTNADLIKGIGYLERSIQQDPNYAPAYTDLAISYAALGSWFGWSPPGKAYPKAKAAALRALALDPNLAEAHTVLGWLYEEWEWNWAGARKELRLAVDLNPNSSLAHSRYAIYLVTTGQSANAESETKRTLELDPLSPLHRSTAAYVFTCVRQYDRAIQEARRAIEIDPTFADAHVNLAAALGTIPKSFG